MGEEKPDPGEETLRTLVAIGWGSYTILNAEDPFEDLK